MAVYGDSAVSVCMPVYNGGAYIAETIQSILSQTYTNFHLIICDNCSTDNTEEVVRSFIDSRIVYSRNEKNIGLVGNANRSIDLADGDYVHILHHDDIMLPDNLERKVRVLDEHPLVGFVHSDVGFIDQNGDPLELTKFDAGRDYIEKGTVFFEKYLLKMPIGASVFIGAVLARRDCYLKVGSFNLNLLNVHDSEMWMRMLLFYDVACIGKRLINYRLHDAAASTAITDAEGLNISGLEEHYLACRVLLKAYPDRIPNWKRLNGKVATAFSMQAVLRMVRMLRQGDIGNSVAFLKTAIKFDPALFVRRPLWSLIRSLIVKKAKKLNHTSEKVFHNWRRS